ncbi:MAG: hypothetical protein MUC71_10165, partial [Steroidobacteraceae bacterium]|nr:hypothetical protein [Steroidobacteraceae bacterium]
MNSLDAESPIEEVAATVSEALAAAGITAVLSGGAAVQIYSEGLYVSRDLDFVSPAGHRELDAVLRKLGFSRVSGRHYVHDAAPYTLEFPPWPLAVGRELIRDWMELPVGRMTVRILTPTQCVMDRLAAFYFWRCHRASDTPQVRASDFPHPLTHRRVFRDHHIRVA